MYPILFRTRWFFVYSYTAVFAAAILLAIGLLWWREGKTAVSRWLDGLLIAAISAVFVGRVSFIVTQLDYFQGRPSELLQPWQGGITFHGAWLGGLLGLWLWSRFTKEPLLPLLNALTPSLALLVVAGWSACWLEGCAYGAETTLSLWSADLPDSFGVFVVRYRVQLFGIICALLLFASTVSGKSKGDFLQFFVTLSLTHAVLTFWRGDAVLTLHNNRIDTALHTLFALISLILLQYQQSKTRKTG